MQSIQKGWVVAGVAALFGLYTIGTVAAQRTSTARQKSFIVLGRQWTACVGPSKGLGQHGIKVRDKRQHPLLQILH